ncbi:MAG: MBL fold metallo-hydrolase [Alphaproteobacteria bacterium]|nr:MBL fold metallo-hydrolase [Alphaproteobacteria bacterium]
MENSKKEIFKNLYQFSTYIPQMDFTIHQYLSATEPAILFAAGTVQQAEKTLPEIQKILGDRPLKYIFVSHFESDEVAGIEIFQKAYPDVTIICGHLAARELFGFGYKVNILPKKGGEILEDGELKLQFIDYPSEVHLQNGLVVSEINGGIFYSADLMLSFGNGIGKIKTSDWKKEVEAIPLERVPNENKLRELKDSLLKISPKFVAVGHGYCINCE